MTARHDVHQWSGTDPDRCIVCDVDWSDADLTCNPTPASRSRIACALYANCQHDDGMHDHRCPASGLVNPRWEVAPEGTFVDMHATPASAEPTDDDRAKAIVAMSQALDSDRLTVGHAIRLVAQLLASQRAEIVDQVSTQLAEIAADMEADDAEYGRISTPFYARRIREAAPK